MREVRFHQVAILADCGAGDNYQARRGGHRTGRGLMA
jgi:hypothetical protein